MQWNQDTMSYRGKTSDGKTVDVTGDEWSEAMYDGIKILAGEVGHSGGVDALSPVMYQHFEQKVLAEIDNADMWAALVGDNPNVEFVEEEYA